MSSTLPPLDAFANRHIGPSAEDIAAMLAEVDAESMDALIADAVPAAIRSSRPLDIPAALDEDTALQVMATMAAKNVVARSCLYQTRRARRGRRSTRRSYCACTRCSRCRSHFVR